MRKGKIGATIFFAILFAIWIFNFAFMGFNIFSIALTIIATLIYCACVGGALNGLDQAKRDSYFAEKYDEAHKKNN